MQSQLVCAASGFALQISDLPQGSLHHEILSNNGQDALAKPSSAHWAAQVVKHVWSLGLPASFAQDATVVQYSLTSPAFVAMRLANLMRSGRACMLPLGLRPPKGPSCAHIIAGLCALVLCQSGTFSCP